MGPLLVGIVVLLLVFLLPVPYAFWLIGTIVGVVLVLYGLYLLLSPYDGVRPRYTRWR